MTTTQAAPQTFKRNSRGMQDLLMDEIDLLRTGKSTPQNARAIGSLASGVIALARAEMDRARFIAEVRTDSAGDQLGSAPPIMLGNGQ